MKYSIFILLVLIVFGCNTNNNRHKKNISLVEKYVKSVEDLEYETMASVLDNNYLGLGPSVGDSIQKEDALEHWKDNIENLYESIHYNRSSYMAETITQGDNKGEWVSNWAELEINYKNNKGSATIWANSIYQIENGKIIKSYTFYNEADVLKQLGYVFINPSDL
jgi:hypothetical protein